MRVPRILPCEEWEAVASAQQDALIAASYEDRSLPEVVVMVHHSTNSNEDHNAANGAAGEAARSGARPYLQHREQQIRQLTSAHKP